MSKGSKDRSNRKVFRSKYPECAVDGCGRMRMRGGTICATCCDNNERVKNEPPTKKS